MKFNKILMAGLALGLTVSVTSCRDDYSDLNQNPSAVTKGEISYLFAEAVNKFDPQPYLEYYYNAPMKYQWSGMGISTGGASDGILTLTATGDQQDSHVAVLRVLRAMEHENAQLSEETQALNDGYLKAANILSIYMGLFATDMYGSIPYTEACQAAYGGTITPAYDTVESLYDLWLTQLDEAITTFTGGTASMLSSQDVVYGGDLAKWAKLANSLKLRIAVRLLNQNKTKALQIASAVESASCGYIDSPSEDFRFAKGSTAITGSVDDYLYHWSNGFTGTAARKAVVDFMIDGKDPRVRFFYKKNSWSSAIVQGYYDDGKEIPDFIEKDVEYTTDENGKKHFVAWKGLGEPWVRYHGMTEEWMAGNDNTGAYRWYFPSTYAEADKELYLHNADGQNATGYTVYSALNQMMIIGRSYSAVSQVQAATLPSDSYTFTENSRPWTGCYLSAAEVNLYLAEFAMLNNNESKAKTYYENALRYSCQTYDELAKANLVAYSSKVAGCFENYKDAEGNSVDAAIDLQDGEIDAMLASEKYAFTGTAKEKLEKIYIQEMLNFTLYPNEVYVTARRSGYPSYTSTLLPREDYRSVGVPSTSIPRRFPTGAVTDTDLMRDIKTSAYAAEGLTMTSDGLYNSVLATERLWQDQNAPEWGAGQ